MLLIVLVISPSRLSTKPESQDPNRSAFGFGERGRYYCTCPKATGFDTA